MLYFLGEVIAVYGVVAHLYLGALSAMLLLRSARRLYTHGLSEVTSRGVFCQVLQSARVPIGLLGLSYLLVCLES